MSNAFVWFQNGSKKINETISFYEELLGWQRADGPPGMQMFGGAEGPFAAIAPESGVVGWIPYAQVGDVDRAIGRAEALGASVIQKKARGPAGEFAIVRDPGGAALALWQKA